MADVQDLWPVKPEPEGSCPALSYLLVLGAWPREGECDPLLGTLTDERHFRAITL